jgi:hypothetical protein
MPLPSTSEAAVEYAERLNWAVFPCRGKVPAQAKAEGGRGVHGASSDATAVAAKWREFPGADIGLACGTVSGIWVLDVDGDEGAASLADLERQHGPLPATAWQMTGKGRHYFFALPEGVEIRNRTGVRPGLDVRGTGGYVIVAPSLHPSGVRYQWRESPSETEIAPAPAWLVDLVLGRWRGNGQVESGRRPFSPPDALQHQCGEVAAAACGARNDTLNRAAFALGRLVAAGALAEPVVGARLFDAAVACGLVRDDGEEAVRRTIWSGLHAGRIAGAQQTTVDGEDHAAAGPYEATSTGIIWHKQTRDGEVPTPLTNFVAHIVAEVARDDGAERTRHFEISAKIGGSSRRFMVAAAEFAGLAWVPRELGARALVYPGFAVKDHARAAIQTLSRDIAGRTVFAHVGWREVDGRPVYLHAAGAIGAGGPVAEIETDLVGAGLGGFALPDPPQGEALWDAVRASLRTLTIAPLRVTAPLFAATWRAPLAVADFSLHLVGPTGAGKSELAAVAQQHFGADMDSRHLPGSWSSTGNALEAQAFAAKDALLVVDDFAPGGSANDVARLHREAGRLLRAQGNSAGRARLRPDASLRPARPPRGLILSTGEDFPVGQSIRARGLIVEVGPKEVDFVELTAAQAHGRDGRYAAAMAGYLRWLAGRLDREREVFRDECATLRVAASRGSEHRRTPWIVADLGAALKVFLRFALDAGVLDEEAARKTWHGLWAALLAVAEAQAEHQADENPVRRFLALLAGALVSGRGHLADATDPSRAPPQPTRVGWRRRAGSLGHDEWLPSGEQVGWIDNDDVYLQPDAAYAAAQRLAGAQGGAFGIGQRTLWKRLFEAGVLASRETGRGRHTVRRTIGGIKRAVVHIKFGILDGEAAPPALAATRAELPALQGQFPGPISGERCENRPHETALGAGDGEAGRPMGPEGPLPMTYTGQPSDEGVSVPLDGDDIEREAIMAIDGEGEALDWGEPWVKEP